MKIDPHRLSQSPSPAERLTPSGPGQTGLRKPLASTSTDRAEISPDAQLIGAAMRAAEEAPAVRADVVQRARQMWAAGEVGTDLERLADRLIDHLLEM